MVKDSRFFRKQAEKAERIARTVADPEISENLAISPARIGVGPTC
jgi:hypothetical protein